MSRNRLFAAVVSVVALGGGLLSCQTYEVDPVKPAAAKVQDTTLPVGKQLSPNVMLVVDRSGSMSEDPGGNSVTGCNSPWNTGRGATSCKWDVMVQALTGGSTPANGFVAQLAQRAAASDPVRIGLTIFAGDPSQGNGCGAPSGGTVEVPVQANTIDQVSQVLDQTAPQGGTPTAAALRTAAGAFQSVTEAGRPNYIILATDGAPNCNPGFQVSSSNQCTDVDGHTEYNECATPGACYTPAGAAESSNTPLGCLDEDNTVAAVTELAHQGIKTFVIGFGSDLGSGTRATETLDNAATAGGTAQTGSPKFYQANSATDLQNALNAILAQIQASCTWQLDSTPPSASAVEVVVTPPGGTATVLNANQYSVTGSAVTITDTTLCQQMEGASATNPYQVSFKYLGQ